MKSSPSPEAFVDPNVEEIREIRTRLSARFDHDLQKLAVHLREIEQEHAHLVAHASVSGDDGTGR